MSILTNYRDPSHSTQHARSAWRVCMLTASAGAAALLAACGGSNPYDITKDTATIKVEIRRTAYGVPHIVAKDVRSAAYGVAYSYAQDNICVAANQFLTVAGERSKYLGAGAGDSNVRSDYYHRLIFDQAAIDKAFSGVSATTAAAITGYVEGYNRFLADAKASDFAADCAPGNVPADWAKRVLTEADYKRHLMSLVTQAGYGAFQSAITDAQPPAGIFMASADRKPVQMAKAATSRAHAPAAISLAALQRSAIAFGRTMDERPMGSNGQAFGSAATDNGRGLLVGNPHFPWAGPSRFYQAHVQIPGAYNVMGATLGPAPFPVIGFNDNVAWTHTVSTGRRFTLFELSLSGTNYVVDGVAKPITSKQISLDVLANGTLSKQTRTFYGTEYGPILVSAQLGASWTATKAFAIRDANITNGRFLDQWWDMGRANGTDALRQAAAKYMALPWVNTIAADRAGNALYADYSVVPNVSAAHLATCSTSPQAQALAAARTYLLDGSKAACNWPVDPAAASPGIMAAGNLPILIRSDYVGNSNDSAWLANPAQPLTGYSPLVGEQARTQSLRTRMAFTQVQDRLAGTDGQSGNKVSAENQEAVFFQSRLMSAELVRPALVTLCTSTPTATASNGTVVDLSLACSVLTTWDGRAKTSSVGAVVFREFWRKAQTISGLFGTPFNAAMPVSTPRDPAVGNPTVAAAMLRSLADGVLALNAAGVPLNAKLGDAQYVTRDGVKLPISGGDEFEGIFNKITPPGLTAGGYTSVNSGSSYIQIVSFPPEGVNARGLLTYSQSTNPASPYFADQTKVLSTEKFVKFPYTEAEIAADPKVTSVLTLTMK